MRKKYVVVLVIVVLILISIFIILKGKKNYAFQIESISDIEFFTIKEKNKYGVINKNGEVVVDTIYDEVDIPNPSKAIFVCKFNYNTEKQEYNVRVLNDKAESILYEYFFLDTVKLDWSSSEIPFEKSVLKYKKDNKYGLIDFKGNIVVKAKYDEILSLENQEGLLLVKRNGKYGIINIKGDCILKEKYDIIKGSLKKDAVNNIKETVFIVGINQNNEMKYGVVDYKGKKILETDFSQIEEVSNASNDEYYIAFKNDKAGFYKNSKLILNHEYDDIVFSDNNLLIIEKNQKQGVVTIDGNSVLRRGI